MIIFDVGANTGESTKEYISETNIIYAFEPIPQLVETYLLPLQSINYFIIQKAVSDFDGTASFNIAKQDPSLTDGSLFGCSSLYEFSDNLDQTWPGRQDFEVTQKIDVDIIRMDTFIKEAHIAKIDYLHCDTQGNDLKVLNENYFVDLDEVEKYLDMSDSPSMEPLTGNTEMRINIVKFELVKMLLEVVLSENEDIDEKLGLKSSSQTSIPFRLAFNSLLNKKLINHY